MTDASVASALRSTAPLVVVEAPAGCGKTYQGAEYARDAVAQIGTGRVLILTHTHAACDVFAARTRSVSSHVEIRTIDSLITQIGSAYYGALGVSPDAGAWARARPNGYDELAANVATLVQRAPMIADALASRYPIVVCDEHQDASTDQHEIIMTLHAAGARLRVFGDPMQRIYGSRKASDIVADRKRWDDLKQAADAFEELDEPHRWRNSNPRLGSWILDARAALQMSDAIDLRGNLPDGVRVLIAENVARRAGGYQVSNLHGRPIRELVRNARSIFILSRRNDTIDALRSFFNRSIPIWEGHTRDHLSALVAAIQENRGNAGAIARATVAFIQSVAVGFSSSAFGDAFIAEVDAGCVKPRKRKPALLQELARYILDAPDHRGVARALRRLDELIESDGAFDVISIDLRREFSEASRLDQYDDANDGFAEIARRRTFARQYPPSKAISTIHKAKGLEARDVLAMPCDKGYFSNTEASRCLLYVALSRATHSLTLVASRQSPSPLLVF